MKIIFRLDGEPVPYMRLTQGQVKLMRIPDRRLRSDHLELKNRIRKRLAYRDDIRALALLAWGNAGPTSKPVSLTLKISKQIPQGFPRGNRELCLKNQIRPTKKPDLSNYLKIFEDAMNGAIYFDDSQIVRALVEKFYGPEAYAQVEVEVL